MEKIILSSLFILILTSILFPYKHKQKEQLSSSHTDIILGDKSGKHNAINIKTDNSKSMKVDTPLKQITIDSHAKIVKPMQLSKEDLQNRFSQVISAQPTKAFSTNIFFKKGIELTDDYIIKIFQIKNEIKRRQPCEVDIVGFSDTKGTIDKNKIISKKRALLIKKLLDATKVKIKHTNILAYGETNQLVKTADEVSQKENRRVEVIIK